MIVRMVLVPLNVQMFFSSCIKVQKNERGETGVKCNDAIYGERGLQNKPTAEGKQLL